MKRERSETMSRKEIISNVIWFGGLIIVLFILRMYIFTPTSVSGNSMNPTMIDRERVIAMKNSDIKRFDVITFQAPDQPSKNYIKRVIGLPGDSIEIKDDILYINGEATEEPYLEEYKNNPTEKTVPYGLPLTQDFDMKESLGVEVVPENSYFVMGDNRQNSNDSRRIGFIEKEKVLGDVKFVYWPPANWGTFKQGIK